MAPDPKPSPLEKATSDVQRRTQNLSENQKMTIAIVGTIILAILVFFVFNFLNSLINRVR